MGKRRYFQNGTTETFLVFHLNRNHQEHFSYLFLYGYETVHLSNNIFAKPHWKTNCSHKVYIFSLQGKSNSLSFITNVRAILIQLEFTRRALMSF